MEEKDQEAIKIFEGVASRYCETIKNANSISRKELIRRMSTILPELYTGASNLPPTKIVSDEVRRSYHDTDEWMNLFHSLQRKLGSWDVYWYVFDPIHEKDAITQCLGDDLADIYYELEDYFQGLADDATLEDAVWEVRFGFESHWGHHLTSALRVVHELRFRDE